MTMRILVPYDGTPLAHAAIHEACRILTPLDELVILAAVVVPRHVAVEAPVGDVWKETCRAEASLAHAREVVARTTHFDDALHCVRVQAGSRVTAVIAGAMFYGADTILLAERAGLRGRIASFFGSTAAIVRDAPCNVRVLYEVDSDRVRRKRELRATIDVISGYPDADVRNDEIGDESARVNPSRDYGEKNSYAD